jgi:hypothetical protein
MENKMDSLFKKKLEEHSLAPREDAWARVEATLPKKNNVIYWRLAAAILIAGALTTVTVFTLKKSDAPTLAKKSEPVKSTDSVSRKDAKAQRQPEEKNRVVEKVNSELAIKSTNNSKQKTKREVVVEEHQQQENIAQKKSEEKNPIAKNESKANNLSDFAPLREQNLKTDATTFAQTTSTPIEKPIKLEFTLEDVAVDHTAVANTETKNSGLKKMWETALQIKNGEGPMNQLLEKKDELFALNFKKEKQKNQH